MQPKHMADTPGNVLDVKKPLFSKREKFKGMRGGRDGLNASSFAFGAFQHIFNPKIEKLEEDINDGTLLYRLYPFCHSIIYLET